MSGNNNNNNTQGQVVDDTAETTTAADKKVQGGGEGEGEGEVQKKDVLRRERSTVDDIMTVSFLGLVVMVLNHVRSDSFWLPFFLGSLVSVFALINISKYCARNIGEYLSEVVLNTEWTLPKNRRPLKKYQSMKKFTDQAWQLVIHASMTVAEYYVIFHDTPGAPEQNFYDNTSLCWFEEGTKFATRNMEMLYVVQLSIWIVTCFSHRFIEARHKDYYEMYVHHIATIALVGASWMFGYMRIGILVLIIHDCSDVPLDIMKMANYLKLEGPRAFFAVEICFVTNLITWAIGRLYLFPTKAIWSAAMESTLEIGYPGPVFQALNWPQMLSVASEMPGWWMCNCLLSLLLCLHIFWFCLLVRILVKLIKGKGAHKAGEEDYEGQSTDNEG